MSKKPDTDIDKLSRELEKLKLSIKDARKRKADADLAKFCANLGDVPKISLKVQKLFKGHLNKVNAVHFAADGTHLLSAALDGKLIIWDAVSGNKVQIIPMRSSWIMTACVSPSGTLVAAGGMDNMCTVYDTTERSPDGYAKLKREFLGFEGFLSSCRFLDDHRLITGSGDMKVIMWDLEKGAKITEFKGHVGDVVSLSLNPANSMFVTGSVDQTAKVWDLRQDTPVQTFWGHQGDVNSTYFHPASQAFATASEDSSARLFDLRSDQEMAIYRTPSGQSGFTSVVFSKSGRYLLCGSDDFAIHTWDSMKTTYTGTMIGHDNRVSSIDVASNGIALASGSWDCNVKLWY